MPAIAAWATALFVAQGLDGIHAGGTEGGHHAAHQSYHREIYMMSLLYWANSRLLPERKPSPRPTSNSNVATLPHRRDAQITIPAELAAESRQIAQQNQPCCQRRPHAGHSVLLSVAKGGFLYDW